MKATLKKSTPPAGKQLRLVGFGSWIRLSNGDIAVTFSSENSCGGTILGYQVLFEGSIPQSRTVFQPDQSEIVTPLRVVVEVVEVVG